MLSIIVPVRNESNNLKSVFDYFSDNLKNLEYEVLIINDYSEDETLNITKKLVEEYKNFKVFDIKQSQNHISPLEIHGPIVKKENYFL